MTGDINLALLGAAVLHIIEEYGYPGGFSRYLRERLPVAEYVTPGFSITINGLLLFICVAAVTPYSTAILKLSVAALLGINALMHIAGTIHPVTAGVPGVVTSVLLYSALDHGTVARGARVSTHPSWWSRRRLPQALRCNSCRS
ncbi:MAG: HXXEE domain-containing protein [Vicinamibacterales bacterium]